MKGQNECVAERQEEVVDVEWGSEDKFQGEKKGLRKGSYIELEFQLDAGPDSNSFSHASEFDHTLPR
jgi:hypothetical protein